MPFPFIYVSDLLEDLRKLHIRDQPLLPNELKKQMTARAWRWLRDHKFNLNAFSTQEGAVLWILRPDKLTDREYGIDAKRMELIIARAYSLGSEDLRRLRTWQTQPHLGDLGTCVEQVRNAMQGTKTPSKNDRVSAEEIQNALLRIASINANSSFKVQSFAKHYSYPDVIDLLGALYKRLLGREAKWLTRYILKDYGAILLPDKWEMEPGHSGLPNIANITMDIFSGPPPVPIIMEGTRILKGHELASPSIEDRRRARIAEKGWPKRNVRSREASPLSPPTFSKGVLRPDPIRVAQTKASVRPPLKMLLDPIPASSAPRSTVTLLPSIQQTPYSPMVPMTITTSPTIPASSCFHGGDHLALQSLNIDMSSTEQESFLSSAYTSIFSSRTRQSRLPPQFPKGTKTKIVIDLTDSPPPSSRTTALSLPSSPTKAASSPRNALSFRSSNTLHRRHFSPRLPKHPSSPRSRALGPLVTAGTGTCRMGTSECPLLRCIIVLSPCIAESSRLINELLPWHGLQYTTSLQSLLHPQFPNFCPRTRRRHRKVVLIESHNPERTVEFLEQVEALNLRKKVKQGKREGRGYKWAKEYVEVYDWRLLEALAKVDLGREYTYNPWERNLINPI